MDCEITITKRTDGSLLLETISEEVLQSEIFYGYEAEEAERIFRKNLLED